MPSPFVVSLIELYKENQQINEYKGRLKSVFDNCKKEMEDSMKQAVKNGCPTYTFPLSFGVKTHPFFYESIFQSIKENRVNYLLDLIVAEWGIDTQYCTCDYQRECVTIHLRRLCQSGLNP